MKHCCVFKNSLLSSCKDEIWGIMLSIWNIYREQESSTGFVAFGWFIQSNTLSALLCSAHAVKFTHKTVSCNHSVVKLCRSQLSLNMFLNPSQRGTNTREITRKHDHTRKSQSFDTQPNSCWVAKSFPNNFSKISKWGVRDALALNREEKTWCQFVDMGKEYVITGVLWFMINKYF